MQKAAYQLFCGLLMFMCWAPIHTFDDNDPYSFPTYGQISGDRGIGVGCLSESDDTDDDDLDWFEGFGYMPDDVPSTRTSEGVDSEIYVKHQEKSWNPLNFTCDLWRRSTSSQICGLIGIVAVCGYACHSIYRWWHGLATTQFYITPHDKEMLKTLLSEMREDIMAIKDGNFRLPRTNLVDLSHITPELAAECKIVQQTFINMCKLCKDDAEHISLLEEFYSNVEQSIATLEKATETIDVAATKT